MQRANLSDLAAFVVVARERSFTNAAATAFAAEKTVTLAVKNMHHDF